MRDTTDWADWEYSYDCCYVVLPTTPKGKCTTVWIEHLVGHWRWRCHAAGEDDNIYECQEAAETAAMAWAVAHAVPGTTVVMAEFEAYD